MVFFTHLLKDFNGFCLLVCLGFFGGFLFNSVPCFVLKMIPGITFFLPLALKGLYFSANIRVKF